MGEDTDSIFVLGKHDFSWYNEEITNKIKKSCEINELDFSRTRPKTPKGIEKPLGIFDSEDSCNEFITLGAKRYVERRDSDNKLHLTVSGINKGAVELLEDNIENFKDGFDFGEGLSGPIGDAGDQTFRRHGSHLHIDIQHQAEADEQDTCRQHGQLTEIGGQHKVAQNVLGSVHEITKNGGEHQLQQ